MTARGLTWSKYGHIGKSGPRMKNNAAQVALFYKVARLS